MIHKFWVSINFLWCVYTPNEKVLSNEKTGIMSLNHWHHHKLAWSIDFCLSKQDILFLLINSIILPDLWRKTYFKYSKKNSSKQQLHIVKFLTMQQFMIGFLITNILMCMAINLLIKLQPYIHSMLEWKYFNTINCRESMQFEIGHLTI